MDLKLIHRTLPRFCRHEPFLLGVAQGKKEELGSGVIAREVALGADDFTQLEVEGLDCIGRVEDASDLVGEGKEGSCALPVTTPPWSRTLMTNASRYTIGQIALRGRACHACTSAKTSSVTVEIRSAETSVPYSSESWAWMSRTLMPRAYMPKILSSKPS